MTGTISKLLREKYFGFILGSDNREYFFHSSSIREVVWTDLEEGQKVTFDATKGEKGPRAEQVRLT